MHYLLLPLLWSCPHLLPTNSGNLRRFSDVHSSTMLEQWMVSSFLICTSCRLNWRLHQQYSVLPVTYSSQSDIFLRLRCQLFQGLSHLPAVCASAALLNSSMLCMFLQMIQNITVFVKRWISYAQHCMASVASKKKILGVRSVPMIKLHWTRQVLKIQVFCGVLLCHWAHSSWYFAGHSALQNAMI